MNRQQHFSAHFSLNMRSDLLPMGKDPLLHSQRESGTLSPQQSLGSRDPDMKSEAEAVGEGADAAPGLCPAATLVSMVASPTGLLRPLCSHPDSLDTGLSRCDSSPWAPRDPE